MRRISITFLLLVIVSNFLSAQQPVIVKDYNNCTVGLQDGNGNWIGQPIYDDIQPLVGGVGIVIRGGKRGLINSKGKEVIPAIYQTLNFVRENGVNGNFPSRRFLKIFDGRKYGVVDTSGQVIISSQYNGISELYNDVFKVFDNESYWCFYHLDGKIYPTGLSTEPEMVGFHLYTFRKTESTPDPKKPGKKIYTVGKGLINDSAVVLIPAVYDDVKISESQFRVYEVTRKGKFGYYDAHFKQILACEYDVWRTPAFYGGKVDSYMFLFGVTAITKEGKSGVMSYTGDTLLPIIFDSVCHPEHYFLQTLEFPVWEVVLNQKWGLTDSVGNWIIQPVLDTGDLCISSKYDRFRSLVEPKTSYYVCQIGGKHGAINLLGDTIVPFVYDTSWTNKTTTIFWSPNDAIRIQNTGVADNAIALSYRTALKWFGSDTSIIRHMRGWWGDEGYYPIYPDTAIRYNEEVWVKVEDKDYGKIPAEAKKSKYPFYYMCAAEPALTIEHLTRVYANVPGYSSYVDHGLHKYYPYEYREEDDYTTGEKIELVYDSLSGRMWRYATKEESSGNIVFGDVKSGFGILSSSGHVIVPPGSYRYVHHNQNYKKQKVYLLHTFTGKFGLIDSTGKFILDTVWTEISLSNSDTAWLEKTGTSLQRSDFNCRPLWSAMKLTTGEMIVDSSLRLTQPFTFGRGMRIIHTQSGMGMIDATTLYTLLPAIYSEIIELDDSLKYFAMIDCNGNAGVADHQGQVIVDCKYKRIHMTECRFGNVNGKRQAIETYIFSNTEKDYTVFSANSGLASTDTGAYKNVVQMMLSQPAELSYQSGLSQRQRNMKFVSISKPVSRSLNAWQSLWIFNATLTSTNFHDYRNYCSGQSSPCACNSSSRIHYDSRANQSEYIIVFLSDSFMSVQTKRNYGWGNYRSPWTGYSLTTSNVLQTPKGPVTQDLFSLFADTAWKQIIIDSVMNYLKAHPGIDADCSKPGLIPNLLSDSYAVDARGTMLYPAWRKNTNDEVLPDRPVVFVPWTGLRAHLKPEMERKIFPH